MNNFQPRIKVKFKFDGNHGYDMENLCLFELSNEVYLELSYEDCAEVFYTLTDAIGYKNGNEIYNELMENIKEGY